MTDFHFLRPLWLIALVLPPAIIWLSSRGGDTRHRWKGMIAAHLLERLLIEPDRKSHLRPAWLLAVVLILSALGLAGPTYQREPPPFVSDTASLVIVVDLTPTMNATDISPSRVERAKLKIHDILTERAGARTAVIAYAGTAHIVVPLTEDSALIESYTDALATRLMPKPGKDTWSALRLADRLLQDDGGAGTILLMTDGVAEGAVTVKNQIESGLLVLGIGTAAGGVVEGGSVSKLDLDALKKFAGESGASVATMTNDDADIRWIAQKVATNLTERSAVGGDRWRDLGWWLVIPAAFLFALSFRRGWVTRVATVTVAIAAFLPDPTNAGSFADMWLTPDQQGRRAFERGDFSTAASLFHDPMWRGVSLYRIGKFKEAADAFGLIESPEAWFDRGNALLHVGDFEHGVAAYGKALQLRPNWPEADANLALAKRLLKQQKDDEDQPQEPNEKPDSVQFDDKGKQGRSGTVELAEETSEMWMKNIQASPADLMARKFSIEARDRSGP